MTRPAMRIASLAFLLALTGCASSGNGVSEPPPLGTWRGTLLSLDAGTAIPAQLIIEEGVRVTLIAGAARAMGTDARSAGTRLIFRVDQFPVTNTTRRSLRCDLANTGTDAWEGDCRAGAATYRLRLLRSTRA